MLLENCRAVFVDLNILSGKAEDVSKSKLVFTESLDTKLVFTEFGFSLEIRFAVPMVDPSFRKEARVRGLFYRRMIIAFACIA